MTEISKERTRVEVSGRRKHGLHERGRSTVRRTLLAFAAVVAPVVAMACAGAPLQEQPEPDGGGVPSTEVGARIWTNTCNRCHNVRPATEYTAEQWPVILSHMRTRAHLTRSEAASVTAFLQELTDSS